MAAVEGDVAGAHDELAEERDAEPGTAGDDEQVGRPLGQRVRADRAMGEHGEARKAPDEQRDGGRAAGLRHHRDDRRHRKRRRPEGEDADREHRLEDEQRGDPARPAQRRQRGQREQRGADR
jgi:hypothetical protein